MVVAGPIEIRFGLYLKQWVVGVMLVTGRIIPTKWFVMCLGPLAISIAYGRASVNPR